MGRHTARTTNAARPAPSAAWAPHLPAVRLPQQRSAAPAEGNRTTAGADRAQPRATAPVAQTATKTVTAATRPRSRRRAPRDHEAIHSRWSAYAQTSGLVALASTTAALTAQALGAV